MADDNQLLAMNEALEKLGSVDERKAQLVKLRYFVGLNFEDAAAALGIAVPTAKQWWAYARSCILAYIHVTQQQFDKARPLAEEALNLSRRLPMEKSVFSAGSLAVLGWAYLEYGDVAQAETLCDLAWQAMRRNPAVNPAVSPLIIVHLGAVRLAQQNYAEATTLLREGLRLTEKHDVDAGYRLYVMSLLGASLAGQKNYADAEPLLLQSCEGIQQRQASLSPHFNAPRRITEALERLVQLYDAWGKPAQAAEWKQKLAAFQQAAKAVEKKGAQP